MGIVHSSLDAGKKSGVQTVELDTAKLSRDVPEITDVYFVLASFGVDYLDVYPNLQARIYDPEGGRELLRFAPQCEREQAKAKAVVMCSLSQAGCGQWTIRTLGLSIRNTEHGVT